jgi:putative transposase
MAPLSLQNKEGFVDTSYFKVRNGSRHVTKAFLVVVGVRDDGYREILGAR